MAVVTMIAAVLKFDSCCGSGELLRLRLLGWWRHDSGSWGKVIVLIGNDGSTFDALGVGVCGQVVGVIGGRKRANWS